MIPQRNGWPQRFYSRLQSSTICAGSFTGSDLSKKASSTLKMPFSRRFPARAKAPLRLFTSGLRRPIRKA
jgi:hypothetical protein